MFDIEDVLSRENQAEALEILRSKRDGSGPDGLRISDFDTYWKANKERIEKSIRTSAYKPGIAKLFEITGGTGKRREIASINVTDRFIERLLQQQFRAYVEPLFATNSFAYQAGKGTVNAAMQARDYIAQGNTWLREIDIKDFFDSLNLDDLMSAIRQFISDETVVALINNLLHREVEKDGRVFAVKRGLLQGSPVSPILSNIYLHPLDKHLEELSFNWLRFADNIYVYTGLRADAEKAFEIIRGRLSIHHHLSINERKSGIYNATDRRVLGYNFTILPNGVDVRRHRYQPTTQHHTWHASVAHKDNGVYHIVQDGIINKKDYSLLFENEDERHHIPIEVTDQINIYGNVSVSPSALRTLCNQRIRISYFDDFGRLMGTFTPTSHSKAAHVFLRQCQHYADTQARLTTARRFEIASIHNMRANIRYYKKKGFALDDCVATLTKSIAEVKECADIESLMLIEARARRDYYAGFSAIVAGAGFGFTQRTKRPPKDACNALISFGNTVLYNAVLQMIWKTSLDPKIGVVHATNRRDFSLNLGFADIFKPIIVDRAIFSLINRHEIKTQHHFRYLDDGAVLLNDNGKRILLESLDAKLDSSFQRETRRLTYRQLIAEELAAFQRMIVDGEQYRPYKYH